MSSPAESDIPPDPTEEDQAQSIVQDQEDPGESEREYHTLRGHILLYNN